MALNQPEHVSEGNTRYLEEEDEDEVDQDNDDEDNKAFCSENRTFNLDDEPKDVRLDRFHLRMGNILRFLMGKREKAVSGDFDPDDKWFCDEFVQPLGKQSVEEIMGIFNDIIPESTRAILGCATLTPEHIMALPSIDHSASDPGVYLICFEKASDLEFEAADVQFTGLNKQDHKVPSGLYTGSSIKSVSGRCVNHGALFKKISTKNLIYGRYLESGTKVMYLYCHANLHELVPVYRQVGVFSQQLENIDLLPTDVQWLVRLLEQVMILLLDVYEPCKDPKLRKTVGYSDRMYKKVLEECGVPLSVFHPLNHAMPLKQTTGNARRSVKHVCHHCGATSAITWYLDSAASEEALLYIFSGQDQLPGHVQVATLLSPSDGSGIRPRRTVFSVRVAVLTGQGIKPIDLKREKSSAQNVEQKTLKATGTLLTTRMEERLENIGALLVL
ncbi:hypothetical protein N7497_004757 [Penicillium chrysogenum]|nr:hypothetical protein N7497_004757 [Penicillium chrysogenum]